MLVLWRCNTLHKCLAIIVTGNKKKKAPRNKIWNEKRKQNCDATETEINA